MRGIRDSSSLRLAGGGGLVGWFVASSIMDRRVISSPLQVEEGCCMNNRDEEVRLILAAG